MQSGFLVILIGALLIGLAVLAWLGVANRLRRRRLARAANELGMSFSPNDPFALAQRHSSFALASAGHSPRAGNVIYGRREGWPVRAFDYHFEAGHGPGRLARLYCVIVVDVEFELPEMLMWHEDDAEDAPLAAQQAPQRVRKWMVTAGGETAAALAEAFEPFADEPVNVETHGGSLMLLWARRWHGRDLPARMDQAAAALKALCPRPEAEEASVA